MITQTLARARILLIVGGGVAAYKSLDLIRRLRERGASVRVAMTAAALAFRHAVVQPRRWSGPIGS